MTRLQPDDRRAAILEAALTLAKLHGYRALTRDMVADAAGVSPALITRYFYAFPLLQSEVVSEAVRLGLPELVAEGLVSGEPAALNAPESVRLGAAMSLISGRGV